MYYEAVVNSGFVVEDCKDGKDYFSSRQLSDRWG